MLAHRRNGRRGNGAGIIGNRWPAPCPAEWAKANRGEVRHERACTIRRLFHLMLSLPVPAALAGLDCGGSSSSDGSGGGNNMMNSTCGACAGGAGPGRRGSRRLGRQRGRRGGRRRWQIRRRHWRFGGGRNRRYGRQWRLGRRLPGVRRGENEASADAQDDAPITVDWCGNAIGDAGGIGPVAFCMPTCVCPRCGAAAFAATDGGIVRGQICADICGPSFGVGLASCSLTRRGCKPAHGPLPARVYRSAPFRAPRA